MQATGSLSNDQLRLATLYAMDLLDSGREERFDQYTRIASSLLNAPVAVIGFADSERQWFKSRVGLEATEIPLDISLCKHTIESGEMTMVEDTLNDPRFAHNPMVTSGPKIRFYAGVPLFAENGTVLGSFCIGGPQPRILGSGEKQTLVELAELVEGELSASRSKQDTDTGLLNRDGFLTLGEETLQICLRQQLPFTLVRLRLHEADCAVRTDAAPVKKLASLLKQEVAAADLVGRVSTRDLAIALCDTSLEQAAQLLDRISHSGQLDRPDMQSLCRHGVHAVAIPYSAENCNDVTGMLQCAFRRMRNSSTNIVESRPAA